MNLNTKIELKDISLDKIKGLLKRKETIITIIVLIFIGGIIFAGNILIGNYLDAVSKRDLAKRSYDRIINADTNIESLESKIETANIENDEILSRLSEISQKEVIETLLTIQKDTGISWENNSLTVKNEIKDAPGLKGISVNISNFNSTYDGIKKFLEYINDFDREITVDALSFSRDKLTGRMSGNMTLMFYIKNDEAT